MKRKPHIRPFHRLVALVAIFLLGGLLISSLPFFTSFTTYAVEIQDDDGPKEIDTYTLHNYYEEFAKGRTFWRTAVNAKFTSEGNSPLLYDHPGAVQLMPVISLSPFTENNALPVKLQDMGVASMGQYIFVVGGNERNNENAHVRSKKVWIGSVEQTSGDVTWSEGPDLPAIQVTNLPQMINQGAQPVAAVSYPAVVAIPDVEGSNSGYLYVIGGFTSPPGLEDSFGVQLSASSAAVHIGRIEDGAITGWSEGPMLMDPETPENSFGLEDGSALSFMTVDGRTFVYLFGGVQNYPPDLSLGSQGSNEVFYAEVGSGGMLYKPSSGKAEEGWETMATRIPTPPGAKVPDEMGLWRATVLDVSFEDTNAVYVIGGQRRLRDVTDDPEKYSNVVYSAEIINEAGNSDNGKLVWDKWEDYARLPQGPVINTSGVQFEGTLYVTGGELTQDGSVQEPSGDILVNYINPDRTLGEDPFLTALNAIKRTRATHGTVVVEANHPTTRAFIYVIGGRSGDSDDALDPDDEFSHLGTDTVLMTKIDPEEATVKIYPSEGWYYSEHYDVRDFRKDDKETTIREIYWSTVLSRTKEMTTDIQLEYRFDSQNEGDDGCEIDHVFTKSQWTPLTSTEVISGSTNITATNHSRPGGNNAEIEPGDMTSKAGCFQYRAKMNITNTGEDDNDTTPYLLNVGVRSQVDKGPNLWLNRIDPIWLAEETRKLVGLEITINNLNGSLVQTTNANFGDTSQEHFFVDLLMFSPGQKAPQGQEEYKSISTSLPAIGGSDPVTSELALYNPALHLYNTVTRDIEAGASFPPGGQQGQWGDWYYASDNEQTSLADAVASLTKTGTYTACLAIDTYIEQDPAKWQRGYVYEKNEEDNFSCVEIDIESPQIEVWIEPLQPDAAEENQVEGTFIISRTGRTTAPLTVTYTLGGSASIEDTGTIGKDYTVQSPGTAALPDETATIEIPSGERDVTFDITPIDDKVMDHDETVVVSVLQPDDMRYVRTEPYTATVTIEDNDWQIFLPYIDQ
jgi:hypothetical protein